MPRKPRPLVAGGTYHVFSRTNPHLWLFEADDERELFLRLLGRVVRQRRWQCLSYCLMDSHFHLLVRTPEGDLSAGMQYLLSEYARRVNQLRGRHGHVFSGRYGSTLVTTDAQFIETLRYVALNPYRAGMTADPATYAWASTPALAGRGPAASFLATDAVDELLEGIVNRRGPDAFAQVVTWAKDSPARLPTGLVEDRLVDLDLEVDGSGASIAYAHFEDGRSLRDIARELRVAPSTVSRRLRRYEAGRPQQRRGTPRGLPVAQRV